MKILLYTFVLLFSGLIAQSQTPAITMTTTTAIGSTFSFHISANADNTAIQVDWGDGTLNDYTIFTSSLTIFGTVAGSTIKIYGNGIISLVVSDKNLTDLDISEATTLVFLNCSTNQLSALDVSKNSALTELGCRVNQLTALDVSKNIALIGLDCSTNLLTTLDVSKNTALNYLYCSQNQLTTLDVSMNTALTDLYCQVNKLTSLDVSKNTMLTNLDCTSNQLTALDMSKNTVLNRLWCYSNRLTTLNVSKNIALTDLYCTSNLLTTIDVSINTALTKLCCDINQLTALDVSKNTVLSDLECSINKLSFSTLPAKLPTWTYYRYSPQAALKLPKNNYSFSETIDLSSQLTVNGNNTSYTWKTMGGTTLALGFDYNTASNGVFTFLKAQTDSVYCQMTNATFPDLTLSTTNVKITQYPSSVNEASLAVNIYPNPVSEILNIEHTENITRVEVFTITGVKVFEVAGSNTNTARIPTADFPKGMLIVKVYSRSGVMERKVLKE